MDDERSSYYKVYGGSNVAMRSRGWTIFWKWHSLILNSIIVRLFSNKFFHIFVNFTGVYRTTFTQTGVHERDVNVESTASTLSLAKRPKLLAQYLVFPIGSAALMLSPESQLFLLSHYIFFRVLLMENFGRPRNLFWEVCLFTQMSSLVTKCEKILRVF